MRRHSSTDAAALLFIPFLLLASTAVGRTEFRWFSATGTGSFLDSAPVFSGSAVLPGDITDGAWSMTLDDSGWPTLPVPREDYVWNTFFAPHFTAGEPGYWIGYLDVAHGLASNANLFIQDDTAGGTFTGICAIQASAHDHDDNEVCDGQDWCDGSLSGVIIITGGSGVHTGAIGEGSFTGSYHRDCLGNSSQEWDLRMYLWYEQRNTSTAEHTWTSIKALYR